MQEFSAALTSLSLTFTSEEENRLVDTIDANGSGEINFKEFCTAFTVSDVAAASALLGISASDGTEGESEESISARTVAGLGAGALPHKGSPTRPGGSGVGGGSGCASGAGSSEPPPRDWERGVIEQVVGTLFEYRVELASAFRMFDANGDGVISKEEFRVGLQALTGLTGSILTDMQCDEILRVLDTDGNGEISYSEFVGAFRLIDSDSPAGSETMTPNVDPTKAGRS